MYYIGSLWRSTSDSLCLTSISSNYFINQLPPGGTWQHLAPLTYCLAVFWDSREPTWHSWMYKPQVWAVLNQQGWEWWISVPPLLPLHRRFLRDSIRFIRKICSINKSVTHSGGQNNNTSYYGVFLLPCLILSVPHYCSLWSYSLLEFGDF